MKLMKIWIVLMAALLGLADSASADLLVHWNLDEGSGAVATDASGNGRDGTINGSPEWVPGVNSDGALHFSGANDYVAYTFPDEAQTYAAFTVAMWLKADDIEQALRAGVFTSHFPGGATGAGFQIEARDQAGTYGYFVHPPSFSGFFGNVSTDWVHIAMVSEGASAQLYYQGAPSATGTFASDLFNAYSVGTNRGIGLFFAGAIDDLRVYDHALTEAEIAKIMAGRGPPEFAADPQPADGALDIPRDVALNWSAGNVAVTHDVYFGTTFGDVNDAAATNPQGVLASQGQDASLFDPGRLAFGQTYYWRVDEVNGAPDFTVYEGDVWNFTTESFSLPLANITATASGSFGASGPENTINGSGLVDELHGNISADMWISAGIPATIEYGFDRAYKLHELWIWNSNQTIEPFIGFGAKDVVIELSLDGENWTVLAGVGPLAQAPGTAGYAHNSTIEFGGAVAQYVRMTINTVHGFAPQASLSEVRFFYIPTLATRPSPDSGTTNVAPDLTLSWGRSGREAGRHEVYLGSDPNTLSLAGSVTESSFDTLALDLQLGQTYSWRVDEVNEAEDPSTWTGDIWNFTTVDTLIIDDMESYLDEEFFEIWATWMDGFEDPSNGSLVGDPTTGSPETVRIYGGNRSLPMSYGIDAATRSEATRTFDAPMDWTRHSVESLVLFFGGSAANTGGQLYLKINDTKFAYDGASSDLMHLGWNRWTIPLSNLSASTRSRVTSLTIGIEGGGSGVLYVDEIQLTTDTRVVVTPTEPSDEALVAHYAFDGDASDSTGQSPGTLFGDGSTFVPGVNGQALRLDGILSFMAIDGLVYDANGLTGATVTAWIRTADEDNRIIASFDRNEYWRLQINGEGGGPGQIGWSVGTDMGQLDSGSSSRVDDDEWHHVAGVFDNGTATIYIDGYHEAPVTLGSTYGSGNVRYGFVGVGSEATAFNGAQTTQFFIGDLDDVRIYQRALSAAEVAGMAGRTDPFEQP